MPPNHQPPSVTSSGRRAGSPYLVAPAHAPAALLLDLLLLAEVAAEQALLQGPGAALLGQQPLGLAEVLYQLE